MEQPNERLDIQSDGLPAKAYEFSYGKLAFLGMLTIFLCYLGPLSLFAPVPLAMAILLYGRAKTALVFVFGIVALTVISFKATFAIAIGVMFVFAYLFSNLIAEIIIRDVNPVYGLFRAGGIMVVLCLVIFGLFTVTSDVSLSSLVNTEVLKLLATLKTDNADKLAAGGADARVIKDLLERPQDLVDSIVNWAPAYIFSGIFIGLWASLFVVLRNALVWKRKQAYHYTVRDLLEFKTPEYLVIPLIIGLLLFLGGDYVLGDLGEVIGGNILYCLGVFYFFQGFGVFSDFITHLKIFGFFRSLMIILTVFMAFRVLVVVGVFDLWLNFRKFFKKSNNEGDKS